MNRSIPLKNIYLFIVPLIFLFLSSCIYTERQNYEIISGTKVVIDFEEQEQLNCSFPKRVSIGLDTRKW